MKFEHVAFNKENKQTIEEFDAQKRSQVLLLQDDDVNNQKTYMMLMAKA